MVGNSTSLKALTKGRINRALLWLTGVVWAVNKVRKTYTLKMRMKKIC